MLIFVLFSPCIVNNYGFLAPRNVHVLLIYISPYLAPTFFGWSPSSESSNPNSLKLTATNIYIFNVLLTVDLSIFILVINQPDAQNFVLQ